MQPLRGMLARPLRSPRSVMLVISTAFLVGAASAEVAVRTHDAIERVRHEREIGAAGQLVQLQISGPDGEVLWATPAAVVRQMPSMRLQLTLASGGTTRAELGRYVLDHSASTPPA